MGRGTVDGLFTVWMPLGDVKVEHGALAICDGSNILPSYGRIRQTYTVGSMTTGIGRRGG